MDLSNRRNFYRMDDQLHLSYEVIPPDNYLQRLKEARQQHLQLLDLNGEALQFNVSMQQVKIRFPELAGILNSLLQRIELLEQRAEQTESDDQTIPNMPPLYAVNISAGGIAFVVQERVVLGSGIIVKLILDQCTLNLHGQIVGISEDSDGKRLNVQFDFLSEAESDPLVEYIMRRQNAALRLKRGLDEPPASS